LYNRGFGGPRIVPHVEALKRVDGEDVEAALFRGGADLRGSRAVGERNASEVVANLNVGEAELACQVEESLMSEARRDHVVERNLHVRNIHFGLGGLSSPLGRRNRRAAAGAIRRARAWTRGRA
jgi:hypothetical protein